MRPVPRCFKKIRRLERLATSILSRYARWTRPRFMVERRDGLLFLIDQGNAIDKRLLVNGAWEREQIELLKSFAAAAAAGRTQTLFLDIGSHGALYAMAMQATGLFGRVVAFEADPLNAVQLRANLLINGMLETIEVVEKAVSSRAGTTSFHMAADYYRGGSRIDPAGNSTAVTRTISVDTIALDDLLHVKGATIVAKIDVEGHEHAVISGMPALLADNQWVIQVESFPEKAARTKEMLCGYGLLHVATIDFDHYFTSPDVSPVRAAK